MISKIGEETFYKRKKKDITEREKEVINEIKKMKYFLSFFLTPF